MTRSSHIAVVVSKERLDEAVEHYKNLLNVIETKRDTEGVELAGENFMLFVEPGESPIVLQEFISQEKAGVRSKFESAGCKVFGESEVGFHVIDPYGMNYHVWLDESNAPLSA